MAAVVTIPYEPRPLQLELHRAMETHRWVAAVCHRRFGKTVAAINQLLKCALLCRKARPRFGYIAPTYTQGKAIAWDYLKHFSAAVPDVKVNESELRVDYPNGGQIRIYGADNPDSLRGIYLDGVVLDEYGLMPPNVFSEVIRPLLSDREGWALFIGTPNGKNQFYDIVQKAKTDESWFFAEYKASDTHVLPDAELAAVRKDMSADEYAQEYECSFEASVKGAVYIRELAAVRETGRLTMVPHDPLMPVDTGWDLGVSDSTAIWFAQLSPGGEIRLIDYYIANGMGLDHYAKIVKEKPYVYGTHYAPHDIAVKELTAGGRNRLQMARGLGLDFRIVPAAPRLQDDIQAVRAVLQRCWFDVTNTRDGFEALQHYRWDYNSKEHYQKPIPVHNWASHGADAFRTFAVGHRQVAAKRNQTLRELQRDDEPESRMAFQGRRGQRRGGY